ncbi:hypothetical protein [Inhella proteolytica]|uniref:DUF4440 domain-containing protein n=1 Tax=Inhella proteolytica TaxID=2795029 RepID=A0A931J030_9BURK|nr:hypothetical protein [Inhella proteolytica]MBH9576996.1 hypothetical protein [Inhella proteolytica]
MTVRPRRPLAAMLLAAALQPALAAPACDSAEGRQAAERLLQRIDASWQARDAAGMAALYHPQGQLRLQPALASAAGRAEVEHFFTALFGSLGAEDDHVLSLRQLVSAGPYCALDAQALVGGANPATAQRFHGFYLVDPQGQDWRIVAVSAVRLG